VEAILKRDKIVILAALAGLAVLSWGYMVREARGMNLTGVCCCAGMKMSGPDMHRWDTAALLPLFLMWSEMMVAMMLPSAVPTILTFAAVNRKRREQERPFVPTFTFMLGYLAIWTAFSGVAALAQWTFHSLTLLSPKMVATSAWLGGSLLIAAGVFQCTPLKSTCLVHCRSPLTFLMTQWRDGQRGALLMGLKHGALCVGCCWALMGLLFAVGVMNMWWVAIIAFFVLAEKVFRNGLLIGKVAGVALTVFGAWVMLRQP
jgi:predicted metal-binding membrane protein